MENNSKNLILKYTFAFVSGGLLTVLAKKLYDYLYISKFLNKNFLQTKALISQNDLKLINSGSEEALVKEQLKRNYEFFGDMGMELIKNAFVVVVGIGGVGRYLSL